MNTSSANEEKLQDLPMPRRSRRARRRPPRLQRQSGKVSHIGAVLLGVLLVKIVLFLWGALRFPFEQFPHESVLSIWNRWDSVAYLTIARQGYTPDGLAPDYFGFLSHFPPLYPLLVALIARLTGAPLALAGMAVSCSAILAASYLLYRLVERETADPRTATLAVVFLNLWPLSYFTLTSYAESLFILWVVLSFYALRRQAYAWAGLAAAAAILTRLPGIALVPAFAVTLWALHRRQAPRRWLASACLLGLPALAVLGYLALNALVYQDPFFFQHEYRTNPFSGKRLIVPFSETLQILWRLIAEAPRTFEQKFMMEHGFNAIFTLVAVLLTVAGVRMRLPWDWTVFSAASVLLFASYSWGISNARYTLPIFPLYVVLARLPWRWRAATLAACVPLLLYFTAVYTRGAWAF